MHARTLAHARTHARMHTHTHARMRARTHARTQCHSCHYPVEKQRLTVYTVEWLHSARIVFCSMHKMHRKSAQHCRHITVAEVDKYRQIMTTVSAPVHTCLIYVLLPIPHPLASSVPLRVCPAIFMGKGNDNCCCYSLRLRCCFCSSLAIFLVTCWCGHWQPVHYV